MKTGSKLLFKFVELAAMGYLWRVLAVHHAPMLALVIIGIMFVLGAIGIGILVAEAADEEK